GIKEQLEYSASIPMGVQMEKKINWNAFSPEQAQALKDKIARERQDTASYLKIDLPGTILWTIALLFLFVKSLWGPRLIWTGIPFKIGSNIVAMGPSYPADRSLFIIFDIAVLIMSVVLYLHWKADTAH